MASARSAVRAGWSPARPADRFENRAGGSSPQPLRPDVSSAARACRDPLTRGRAGSPPRGDFLFWLRGFPRIHSGTYLIVPFAEPAKTEDGKRCLRLWLKLVNLCLGSARSC